MGPRDWGSSACKKCLTNGAQPDGDSHSSGLGVTDGTISQIARSSQVRSHCGGASAPFSAASTALRSTSRDAFAPELFNDLTNGSRASSIVRSPGIACPLPIWKRTFCQHHRSFHQLLIWIQLSRHVVPKSRVAIATQAVYRDWWRQPGSALAIAYPIPGLCKCRRCMKWRRTQRIAAEESC